MSVSSKEPAEAVRRDHPLLRGGDGSLRAAVLGMNDGLISNFSLVMGVAGGTADPQIVLLAGVAGLLAGASSMAAGEYISMRSQRDVFEHQIEVKRADIRERPDEETARLAAIYRAKGLSEEEADAVSRRVMAQPDVALDTVAREGLGVDPDRLGSPWGAAISSFFAVMAGASVPILPWVFGAGDLTFSLSAGGSATALVLVGGTLAKLTGRNIAWGALRMLLAGGLAATATYLVGTLIGVAVNSGV